MMPQFRQKLFSGFGLLLVAAVLLLSVAALSFVRPLRLDLTENHLYTLSDGTRHLLDKLDADHQQLKLTLYYSDKVTQGIPTLRTYAKRVHEMLHEYELQSHGRISLAVTDPEPFSAAEDRAAAAGLQGVPGPNNEKIYFGLVGTNGSGKQETIAFFNPEQEDSLEYDISQLIYRLQQTKTPVVGIISDLPLFEHISMRTRQRVEPKLILDQVRQMFDVKRVYDNNIDKIDDEVDVLMVVHPHLWPENTLYAIDQFVLRGGRLLVFMDPNAELDESEAGLFGGEGFQDKSSSLEQLLTAWGVDYDPKKVLTDYHFAHSIPVTRYGQALPHVGVLGIRDEGFNRQESMTAHVEQVNLASSGVIAPLPGASTRFTPLMQSSAESELMSIDDYTRAGNHGELLKQFKADGHGPYTIAAYITGPAKTAFPNGKPQVKGEGTGPAKTGKGAAKSKSAAATVAANSESPPLKASTRDINVVIFADTDILDDRMWVDVQDFYGQRYAKAWASNSDLIMNVLERLVGSVDLINVRSRGSYNRPFERVNELEKAASEKFSAQQDVLQKRLKETEDKMMSLSGDDQRAVNPAKPAQELTPEQKAELEKFRKERAEIRLKLREVQHQLNQDIDHLGTVLKMINILAVPVALSILTATLAILRNRRKPRGHTGN